MSHFSRIQTKITEKPFLLAALKDLGFNFEEGSLQVRSLSGQKATVQIKVSLPLSYDLGFIEKDGAYEVVADWAGIHGLKRQEFIDHLTQRYAYHAARGKLEAQGFTLVEEREAETGQIRLLLRRMA
jgi:hypothetical protein